MCPPPKDGQKLKNWQSRLCVMGQSLLPVRPRPKFEESFSSWLVRVAWSNGIPPGPFCHRLLSHHLNWTRDADRPVNPATLQILSRATCIPISQLLETTVQYYENLLFDQTTPQKTQTMITSLGLYHRTHRTFGQTYCPRCLATAGYYRLPWRFVLVTACTIHKELLWDRCWKCGSTVCLHSDKWHCCDICGADRRNASIQTTDASVLEIQSLIERCLRTMEAPDFSETPSAKSYFRFLYDLMKLLHYQNPRIIRLREEIADTFGELAYIPPNPGRAVRLESLDCRSRHQLLAMVARLLPNWPERFVRLAKRADCWASFLLKDMTNPHPALINCSSRYLVYKSN